MAEHDEQKALFTWARYMAQSGQIVELANLFAVPNGGHRHKATAAKMRDEGAEAGVPDIFLAWPSGPYHGLFIEMKFGRNKPTVEQQNWMERLELAGYKAVVCYSFEEAKQAILDYLELDKGEY